jgi:SAM-dependent methyltransferase
MKLVALRLRKKALGLIAKNNPIKRRKSMVNRVNFHDMDVNEWYGVLARSVNEPVIDGIEMARFPHASVQRGYVGQADAEAMGVACNFHNYVTKWAAALGHPIGPGSSVLDFGCGWGRVQRVFSHEVDAANLYGVDVDFSAVAVCRNLGVPGQFHQIEPRGTLPHHDGMFDVIYAVSVFTHLSIVSADHWMAELYRTMKPGGVLAITVESREFLERIPAMAANPNNLRSELIARYAGQYEQLIADYDAGEFVFMANGTGDVRASEYYGDAAISEAFFRKQFGQYFRLVAYIEAHQHVGQAIIIAIKD